MRCAVVLFMLIGNIIHLVLSFYIPRNSRGYNHNSKMASRKLVNSFSLDYSNGTRGKGRLTFSIYEGSVIQTNAEAIISVDGGGGLSEAIIKAAGNTVCDEIVANKTRKLTENIVTKAGNLQCKYIVHCKCPKWNDYDNGSKKVCLDDLNITVKKALVAACDKGLKSVALPPIGLGRFVALML